MLNKEVLFPYLEKHGITQPPAIMWQEHNKIREIKKNVSSVINNIRKMSFKDFARQIEESSNILSEMLTSHFYKENNILFPTALKVVSKEEWSEIRTQFDELGYCCFTPEPPKITTEGITYKVPEITEDKITFETGNLTKEEIEAIFNTLPIDISFVDKEDTVQYFNQTKDRIFPRTKAVIGRKVQQCHPQKVSIL